jgi:hypothetical protein
MADRFTLAFPDGYRDLIDGLQAKTGIKTQTDLFENAVALFAWAVKEIGRGKKIASVDDRRKSYNEIHMPALMTIKPDNTYDGPAEKKVSKKEVHKKHEDAMT